MDQTQREFLVEIEELVELIFADLDQLRGSSTDAGSGREGRELIDRIFRRVHSVKGSAASGGLEVVSHIAHEFENLLDAARSRRIILDDAVLDTCESATEALAESLSLAASGIVEPSRRTLFDRLQAAAQGRAPEPSGDTEAILKTIPFEIWESLTESEKNRLVSIVEEGSPLFVVATSFDMADFDEQFFRLKQKLAQCGEVISTSPAVDEAHPGKINFRVFYASTAGLQSIQEKVAEFSNVAFKQVASARRAHLPEDDEETSPIGSTVASVSSLSNVVRTDLDTLDRLISSTHELFGSTSKALDLAMSQIQATTPAREELGKLDKQIRSSFTRVEDELINLRMVSLGPTLQRAARAGRAAARLAAKEIDFEIIGGDLRLDKLLAEAIADPLIHLVRNAVGHGIESSEARVQAGKKQRGTVRIEAVSEGSQSRVRVTDDGRGIDPLLVSEAATRLGIVANDSTLDIDRSLRLIFRPGFTTLDSVSDVSGRGVGLDVVETAVEQVGGELRVSSAPMRGATFEIRLPVTFGLLAATVVVSANSRYCIPASQTVAIDVIDTNDAGDSIDAKKIMRGNSEIHEDSGADQLLLISLRDLLGQPPEKPTGEKGSRKELQLITCQFSDEQPLASGSGTRSISVLVDAVEGTEEVLVRNLGRHAGRWYGVAGATELRDGTVALVLDIPRLLNRGFVGP